MSDIIRILNVNENIFTILSMGFSRVVGRKILTDTGEEAPDVIRSNLSNNGLCK